jgi:uncharacterized protein (DUF302 family)
MAAGPACADSGIISVKSAFAVDETVERLTAALEAKGMTVFLTVDHAKGAQSVGVSLRPTVLVIFGNPKVGSGLMMASQTAGLDLPQKALVWQDGEQQVWLSYNDPVYLAQRHRIPEDLTLLKTIQGALAGFAKAATAP